MVKPIFSKSKFIVSIILAILMTLTFTIFAVGCREEGGGDCCCDEPIVTPTPCDELEDFAQFASFKINMPGVVPPQNINQSFLPLDRYDWQNATFTMVCNTYDEHSFDSIAGRIRGRGNSTWNVGTRVNQPHMQKWPFRIRFNTPQSMLGSTSVSTDWSFIANLSDYSQMRNEAKAFLGRRLSGMDWQTRSRFVHVYFNGQYRGVYWMAEQLQANTNAWGGRPQDAVSGRVDVVYHPDPAISEYFIELDLRVNQPPANQPDLVLVEGVDYIRAAGRLYDMRFPDDTRERYRVYSRVVGEYDICDETDEKTPRYSFVYNARRRYRTTGHFDYARDFLTRVDSAIVSRNWSRITDLIDVSSFVDFYLVQELFKEIDVGGLSIHMTIRNTPRGRRIFKGPLWDFDLSAGNADPGDNWSATPRWNANGGHGTTGIWAAYMNRWFRELMRVPQFFNLARERFLEIAPNQVSSMQNHVLRLARVYQDDFDRNFERWNLQLGRRTWVQPPDIVALDSFMDNVRHLVAWFCARVAHLTHFFTYGQAGTITGPWITRLPLNPDGCCGFRHLLSREINNIV